MLELLKWYPRTCVFLFQGNKPLLTLNYISSKNRIRTIDKTISKKIRFELDKDRYCATSYPISYFMIRSIFMVILGIRQILSLYMCWHMHTYYIPVIWQASYGTKYSRMDQIKFSGRQPLKKLKWYAWAVHILSKLILKRFYRKALFFLKIFQFYSWILGRVGKTSLLKKSLISKVKKSQPC